MPNFTMKQPNPFVRGAAITDARIIETEDAMIEEGAWPKSRPLPIRKFTNEVGVAYTLWHRGPNVGGEWVLDYKYPDGQGGRMTSTLRSELLVQISREQLEVQAKQAEIEEQAAPVVESTDERTLWGENYPQSGGLFLELSNYMSKEIFHKMFQMIYGMLGHAKLPMTEANLDYCWRQLWDTNNEFAGYIEAARAEKSRLESEAQAAHELAAIEAQREAIVEASSPSVNAISRKTSGIVVRNEAVDPNDLSLGSTKEGLKKLRLRAVPSLSRNR